MRWAVVVPSVGRSSLHALLRSLAAQDGPLPDAVVVVDDRREATEPLDLSDVGLQPRTTVTVLHGGGRGPAAARNTGWRATDATDTEWVAFLDDDVLLPHGWAAALERDLTGVGDGVGGVQGRIEVPLPAHRAPTDWERNTAGLRDAAWATADMAYRRAALEAVAGFDERFPRAYREDADLALRVRAAGWELGRGSRHVIHPVRPADRWVSVRVQAGNADDPLMARLHGPRWRERASVPPGRRSRHVAVTAAALGTV
ncbi:MAG: glycosyltransferase, partial [Actinomycetota bacterium]|nr:glycosyltransferase [Actinomycetota bacterium]